MRARLINESALDYDRVNFAGKIEINVDEPIQDKFRMFGFEIPEEKQGEIIFNGEKAGMKYSGSLHLDPDFVLQNFKLVNNIIELAKAPFWYVNDRQPKFNADPKSPYVISKENELNDMKGFKKWSNIYKIVSQRKKEGGIMGKFENLATGKIEEWWLLEGNWRRIPVEELKRYLTSLRDKLDEMILDIK